MKEISSRLDEMINRYRALCFKISSVSHPDSFISLVKKRELLGNQISALQDFLKSGVHKIENKRPKRKEKSRKIKNNEPSFYNSKEWRTLRYRAIEISNGKCQACGFGASEGKKIHVDHIKPRSKYPELELDINNLQILCEDCNLGKSNIFDTDWRSK